MPEPLTLYRLIILYMLNKIDFPLTNTQITNFILEKDYTNYFNIQQSLSELIDSELIVAESTHNNTMYRITPEGKQVLEFFSEKISDAIKKDIVTFFQENQLKLKNETSVISDYYKTPFNNYAVRCQIRNGEKSIIDLTISVATREQASAVCDNWKTQSADIYAVLMDKLIQ